MKQIVPKIFLILILLFIAACSASRKPIPTGVVPEQGDVHSQDEQYGQEVLNQLTQQYPLDRNDQRINRVREVVERLTKAARADHNQWHVHVLVGDEVKNAAATRGNFIFVWTGILKTVQSDAELATILSHEIGHVLAGHTAPDPSEEVNRIIAGMAGVATGTVVAGIGRGLGGPVSDLAELIVRASLEALLVNPGSQDKELEADQIGIFMMADAKYNPQDAIQFWDRVKYDPDFSNSALEFLSSHPSSGERVEKLRHLLKEAELRYQAALAGKPPPYPTDITRLDLKSSQSSSSPERINSIKTDNSWIVVEEIVNVYTTPSNNSEQVGQLKAGTKVQVNGIDGRWLELISPIRGYVIGHDLAPAP